MDFDDTIPLVQNLLIVDSEGKRIAVKYFTEEWCGNPESFASTTLFQGDRSLDVRRACTQGDCCAASCVRKGAFCQDSSLTASK